MSGQKRIKDILARPDAYIGEIVNIDGILLVGAFSRSQRSFRQVWIAEARAKNPRGIRGMPIHSDSTLWHGLSRLSARHVPGYQQFRVHDAVRACVRIIRGDDAPRLELLTAAVFRQAFTLFVGEDGIRLEQAARSDGKLLSVDAIESELARHLNRVCQVYGTLTVKTAPAAQYLAPGKMAYITAGGRAKPPAQVEAGWLTDIAYPQSDSRPEAEASLANSLHIDPNYRIGTRLRLMPGINQTSVKPAIVVGKLVSSGNARHFAGMTDIRSVYLQNLRHDDGGKSFESVLKLKNFARSGA